MSDNEPFDVVVESGVVCAIFRPSYARIDEPHIELANRKLTDLVAASDSSRLVIDLTNVNFFGSSFIEVMFRAYKRIQSRDDAKFALCGLTPYCREVLEITHLDTLWPIYDTRADAVAQLQTA